MAAGGSFEQQEHVNCDVWCGSARQTASVVETLSSKSTVQCTRYGRAAPHADRDTRGEELINFTGHQVQRAKRTTGKFNHKIRCTTQTLSLDVATAA